MIITKTEDRIESNGILKEIDFGIKPENMGTIFEILRSSLYSDKVLCVIREYSANNFDAHVASNQSLRPIKINLPSQLSPEFRTRDYGHGLSPEEVEEIFVNYGSSTKSKSNSFIGAYGIGAKSGWAYTESFNVNSYHKGKLYSYGLYIDESKRGKMSLMAVSDTDAESGVEVVIPVKNLDINTFKDKAINFFKFWSILPEFEGLNEPYLSNLKKHSEEIPVFQGEGWKVFNDSRQSYAIMGNVPYKIDRYILGEELNDSMRILLSQGCYLYFGIGELSVVASREAVEWVDKSKKAVASVLQKAYDSIKKDIEDQFTNCPDLWTAKSLYHNIFDLQGKYYNYRNIVSGALKFNGKPLNNNVFFTNSVAVNICAYSKVKGRRYHSAEKIRRSPNTEVRASKDNIIVINDLALEKGLMNRIVPLIEDKVYKTVYLIEDGANKDKWVQETDFDGPTLLISTLPKVNLQKYNPKASSGSTYIPVTRSKVLVLGDVYRDNRRAADYWSDATIDIAQDSGVYLPIHQYKFSQSGHCNYQSPHYLGNLFSTLFNTGIKIPTVYGVKMSAIERAKKNKNMVNLFDWIKGKVTVLVKNEEQDLINYESFFKAFEVNHHSDFLGVSTNIMGKLDKDNDLAVFMQKLEYFKAAHNRFENLLKLAKLNNIDLKAKCSFNGWEKELKGLEKKYPLFFRLIRLTGAHGYDKVFEQELVDYINLISNRHN